MRSPPSLLVGAPFPLLLVLFATACPAEDPSVARAQAQEPEYQFETALPCFLAARDQLALSDEQRLYLCLGSRSTAPVACFRAADRTTFLSDPQAIELCRCAEGNESVECFNRFRREAFLSDSVILEACRPIVARKLNERCIPIVGIGTR